MEKHLDLQDIRNLQETLKARYPHAVVDLDIWGTGRFGTPQASLYVGFADLEYVVEYVSGRGYGVTRATNESVFLRGYDVAFATIEEARDYLMARLPSSYS